MSKEESKPNSKLNYKLIYQQPSKYPHKVEKVPSPSKPCGKTRRKLKKIEGKN
jgi:hypothetical protein